DGSNIVQNGDGSFSYDLSQFPDLELTAGQSYYWGIIVHAGGRTEQKWMRFETKPIHIDAPFNGVTIITHGFELFQNATPQSFIDLGEEVARHAGGGVVLEYDKAKGRWVSGDAPGVDGATLAQQIAGTGSHNALVLVFDWAKESYISDSG